MAAVMLLTGVCSTLPVSAGVDRADNAQMVGTSHGLPDPRRGDGGGTSSTAIAEPHHRDAGVDEAAKRSDSDSLRNHQLWCVMQIAEPSITAFTPYPDDGEDFYE